MKIKNAMLLLLSASIATVGACSAQPKAESESNVPAGADSSHEASGQQPAGNTFTGEVVETMDAGTYTYVRVENDGAEIWAAAGRFEIAVGDRVVVPLDMAMENFHSDTLDRDFPVVYFAQRIAREGEATAATMPVGHPPVTGAAASHGSTDLPSVDPVEGGITVGEIWTSKEALAGTTITVRGKVVKFNGGILGTNWFHIQDGSGDPSAGTHDITVTSSAIASMGDVITVTGPVVVDQDFGAGYSYPVMIKDATIVVQ